MSPVNGSSKSPFKRIGLSEYTSQRLAELKARRAEADEEMKTSPKSKGAETDQLEKESNNEDLTSSNRSPTKQQESGLDSCFHQDQDVHANEMHPFEIKVLTALPEVESRVLTEGHSQLSSDECSTLVVSRLQNVTSTFTEEVTTRVVDDDAVCQRVSEDENQTKESTSPPLLSQDNCSADNQFLSSFHSNQMVSDICGASIFVVFKRLLMLCVR